jgi:hypothetical protein
MGVPTSEVGYTSATNGRGDHEVLNGHVGGIGGGILKPSDFPYVLPGLTFKNSTLSSLWVECFVRISEQTAAFAVYVIN